MVCWSIRRVEKGHGKLWLDIVSGGHREVLIWRVVGGGMED